VTRIGAVTSKKATAHRKPVPRKAAPAPRERPGPQDRKARVSRSIDKVLTKHAETMAKLAR